MQLVAKVLTQYLPTIAGGIAAFSFFAGVFSVVISYGFLSAAAIIHVVKNPREVSSLLIAGFFLLVMFAALLVLLDARAAMRGAYWVASFLF